MYITPPHLTPPPHTHPRRSAALVSSHIGIFLSSLVALCACIIALYWLQSCFQRRPRPTTTTTTTTAPVPRLWPFRPRDTKWPRHHVRSCSDAAGCSAAHTTRIPPRSQMAWWEPDTEEAIEMQRRGEGRSRGAGIAFMPFIRQPARAATRAGRRRRGDGGAAPRWAEQEGDWGMGSPPPRYEDSGRDVLGDVGGVPGYECVR